MHDPVATWLAIWAKTLPRTRDFLIATFSADFDPRLFNIVAIAPVLENAGFFEPHPMPARAAKSAWRCVIAARANLSHPDHHPSAAEETAVRHALLGDEIIDLVACTLDLQQATSRLLGMADVLGWPPEAWMSQQRAHVHATPLAWLRDGCRGVVLVGTDADSQAWLRGCAPGLVVDNRLLGEALLQKMRREIPPLPPVLVRA